MHPGSGWPVREITSRRGPRRRSGGEIRHALGRADRRPRDPWAGPRYGSLCALDTGGPVPSISTQSMREKLVGAYDRAAAMGACQTSTEVLVGDFGGTGSRLRRGQANRPDRSWQSRAWKVGEPGDLKRRVEICLPGAACRSTGALNEGVDQRRLFVGIGFPA